eukprot:TRINITY_DN7320_c1_g1_i1.p1 TRINITY_DN7320_c1_g1~~TRINITY_DN7320_c1_g1_i1.p1  ORF type:complete len:759 (+),score=55.49 TRINITY_DN7320_c1_g1_i1:79-2355(+)
MRQVTTRLPALYAPRIPRIVCLRHSITLIALARYALASVGDDATLGTCGLRAPLGFSCTDLPEYASFLKKIKQNALKGFPVDFELYQEAHDIVNRWQTKKYVDHPPEGFYKYLCGVQEWPLPDNMCLYGFVSALLVRTRHLMEMGDADALFQAKLDLEYGVTVLGNELCLDFLDASPWPISVLDLYLNMNQSEFLTLVEYTDRVVIQAPVVPFHTIAWQESWRPLAERGGRSSDVIAVVLGSHATLSMEPVDMINRFVHDVHLHAIFVGIETRWCAILGACNQGAPALAKLVKASETDPFGYPWRRMLEHIGAIHDSDADLRQADLLICTEPMAVCLMLKQVAGSRGQTLPVLGYMGVALLNGCPPEDLDTFWDEFGRLVDENGGHRQAVLAVNNMILSEQIFYQTGKRMPYVRAHGLYTGASYNPLYSHDGEVLMWRAPLFAFATLRCAMSRFIESNKRMRVAFKFLEDDEHMSWKQASQYRTIVLLPWDHALMTFYEFYSMAVPLLLPSKEWMYRLIYQRGQLSVGERWYQSIMLGHEPPHAKYEDTDELAEDSGPPTIAWGFSASKAARGAAEHLIMRGMNATDVETAKEMMAGALTLVKDMAYFLAVAQNKTDVDSFTSMGVVRGVRSPSKTASRRPRLPGEAVHSTQTYHPYTPFQMSNRDSNDWTRKRMGGWWLRRGVRFDAMRYWYQYSDFARFPGLVYFDNLVELFCVSQTLNPLKMHQDMLEYNEKSRSHSASFWATAILELLGETNGT